ncbi:MAG: glycosyltransferase family 39 protein [Bacteroidetes bacterium]|nr:glycosyltransferase family 39 protein [Bacteroidota bacterium]MCW5897305.1 glycosyltransferase family 39 protein [Bacteroidota bacterium]
MHFLSPLRIALLAGAASLLFSFLLIPFISESHHLNPDPDRFGEVALSVANGDGFVYEKDGSPVLERTPLYTFIVAGLFAIAGGYSVVAVQIYQAVLHGLASVVVFAIVARLLNRQTAIVCQSIFALHPIVLWYTARIWVETTHTCLLVLIAYTLLLFFESPTYRRGILLGLLTGLSCLVKPILLLFPVIIAVLTMSRFGLQGYKTGIAVLVATFAVVLPWTIRNYEVSGKFVAVNTSLGFNLFQGTVIGENWPSAGMGILDYWEKGKERADAILSPHGLAWESVEGDALLTRRSFDSDNITPGKVMRRFAANFATFWYLSESATKSFFFGVLQVPLLLAGIVSFVLSESKMRKALLPLALLIAYYAIVHGFIVGWGRYSMPLVPLLVILSAPLISRYFGRLKT